MTESFKTSSGLEVTVNVSSEGEPESIEVKGVILSENEILEIAEYIEDYDNEGE